MFNPSLCRMDASDIIKRLRDKTIYYNIQGGAVPPILKPSTFVTYEIKQDYTDGKAIVNPCNTSG